MRRARPSRFAIGASACNNCHGPGGSGEPPAIPLLAGQFDPYIAAQLRDWRDGTRKNDGGQQMAGLAKRLDDRDIAAVAAYYQQVVTAPFSTRTRSLAPRRGSPCAIF